MGFTIERLALDDPLTFFEQIGDPVTDFGGTTVPAPRTALRHSVAIATFPPTGTALTIASGELARRQMRSMLNNTPYKMQAFYINWTADPEQNGWYVPDMGQLADGDGSSGLATGFWKLENVYWRKQAARRTHRRAVAVTMLSLTTGLRYRDYRHTVYSTDFSQISPLAVTFLPPSLTDPINSSNQAAVATTPLTNGSDGFAVCLAPNLVNLTTVSFEQSETSQTAGGVLVYDRNADAGTSPDANWTEVYGPDWPWYYPNTSSATPDTPVLSNGVVQVRYDSANTDGFIVSVWTGAAWVDECKVWFQRYNTGLSTPVAVADMNLLSSGLEEYSPERAVVKVVMQAAGTTDTSSREVIYITLQRGWSGPRFEMYPAPTATATPLASAGWICVTPALADSDDSAMAIYGQPSSAGVNVSTALGTGHTGLFAVTDPGGVSSLNDNGFAMLRSIAAGAGGLATAYQLSMAVVQAGVNVLLGTTNNAYGSNRNTVLVQGPQTAGYCSIQLAFPPAQAHQIMEAENMTLGTNTSSTGDATASAGTAASTTRASDANAHVTQATWPDTYIGLYRVYARVRTTAGTMSVYGKTDGSGGTTGATQTTTSTSYVWVDLGDLNTVGNTLEIHAWTSSGTCFVDRIEAYLRQDRTSVSPAPQYEGCADLGQMVLYDSQQLGVQVSRA